MEIVLNNKKQIVIEGETLHNIVIAHIGDKQKGVAVALNNTVVSKSEWATTKINPNDSVLIIKATQGG